MTNSDKFSHPEDKSSCQRWRNLVCDLRLAVGFWEKASAESAGQPSPDEKKLLELKEKIDHLKQQLELFNE